TFASGSSNPQSAFYSREQNSLNILSIFFFIWAPAETSRPTPTWPALAVEFQAELHSTDGDFTRFPGLRWKNPLQH
ncbi:MAG: hypothetical protein WA771_09620, partial [Chthoniobacterales bacterium]